MICLSNLSIVAGLLHHSLKVESLSCKEIHVITKDVVFGHVVLLGHLTMCKLITQSAITSIHYIYIWHIIYTNGYGKNILLVLCFCLSITCLYFLTKTHLHGYPYGWLNMSLHTPQAMFKESLSSTGGVLVRTLRCIFNCYFWMFVHSRTQFKKDLGGNSGSFSFQSWITKLG